MRPQNSFTSHATAVKLRGFSMIAGLMIAGKQNLIICGLPAQDFEMYAGF